MITDDRLKFTQLAATAIYKDVMQHFDRQEGPGSKWLLWKYPDGKRASPRPTRRGGTKLLQDTGVLRASIKPYHNENEGGVKTDVDYAAVHNDGSEKKDIPQREFMWISDEVLEKIEDMAVKVIEGAWKRG